MDVVGWDTFAVSAVWRKGIVTTWNQRTKPRLRKILKATEFAALTGPIKPSQVDT